MAITQKQLADMAGVSVVTIFNALHQSHKVHEDTRKRIFSLMEEYDYSIDGVARSMVRQKTNIVGIIIPTFEVRYYAKMVSVIEKKLHELGYRALISQHLDDPQKEALEIKMLREYRVDGIILRNCGLDSDRDQILKLDKAKIPFVLIDSITDGFEDHFIGNDDCSGSAQLVRHLLEKGRKRIAYVGFHRSGGETAIEKILARTQDNPIDAVFAMNDNTALNIIRQLRMLVYVPQQTILVAGYGGYLEEGFLQFPLPTIRQNIEELGSRAVERLLAAINGSPMSSDPVLIQGSLMTDN